MSQFVAPEITISSEDFVALVALVGLVVGVREQVSLQIGTLVEATLAHRALVRRFLKTKFFSRILRIDIHTLFNL